MNLIPLFKLYFDPFNYIFIVFSILFQRSFTYIFIIFQFVFNSFSMLFYTTLISLCSFHLRIASLSLCFAFAHTLTLQRINDIFTTFISLSLALCFAFNRPTQAHAANCASGDASVAALRRAVGRAARRAADERLVLLLSDANLARHGVGAEELADALGLASA